MHILIIYCHPSEKSYTFQVLQQLRTTLENPDWTVEISDLYAIDFQSDLTPAEYEREGFSKTELPIAADVRAEQERINRADCLLFLYPVWWSDCPAKLKGWFDRVYTAGYAHGYTDNRMKTIAYGLVICTAGHSNDVLQQTGITQSMQTIMLNDRLGDRFIHKEMLILGGTLELEKVRPVHQQQIREVRSRLPGSPDF